MSTKKSDSTPVAQAVKRLRAIPRFYRDGFRSMTLGRSLWMIIAVKLVVMFGILKLFFFPDVLETHFETDADRSNHVIEQLTEHANSSPLEKEGETRD